MRRDPSHVPGKRLGSVRRPSAGPRRRRALRSSSRGGAKCRPARTRGELAPNAWSDAGEGFAPRPQSALDARAARTISPRATSSPRAWEPAG